LRVPPPHDSAAHGAPTMIHPLLMSLRNVVLVALLTVSLAYITTPLYTRADGAARALAEHRLGAATGAQQARWSFLLLTLLLHELLYVCINGLFYLCADRFPASWRNERDGPTR